MRVLLVEDGGMIDEAVQATLIDRYDEVARDPVEETRLPTGDLPLVRAINRLLGADAGRVPVASKRPAETGQ